MALPDKKRDKMQTDLLQWYRRHRRVMPWRAENPLEANPYHVWLSEIMLQQTTVTAVKPYFERFLSRFPTVLDLADAESDEVMQLWAGLGYYARARNLHKCAKVVVAEYDGQFPDSYDALLKLPGIGPYTASAIASIAFNKPYVAVDGNVERVIARLYTVEEPMPSSKKQLKALAEELGHDNSSPTEFTQAFMELGATVCSPKSPLCSLCPWNERCAAYEQGRVLEFPKKSPKKKKPIRHGDVYWLERSDGMVLFRKRADKGLLGGTYELPSFGWSDAQPEDDKIKGVIEAHSSGLKTYKNAVRHVFTHFELRLNLHKLANIPHFETDDTALSWVSADEFDSYGVSSAMSKALLFIDKSA